MSLEKFDNIAVGVIFPIGNRYRILTRLKDYHGKFIKNLNFYGFQDFNNASAEIIHYKDDQGWLIYNVMIDLMERYPNADGWMMLHDDYWLNWPMLATQDITKAWTISPGNKMDRLFEGQGFNLAKEKWTWWRTPIGYNATMNAFKEVRNEYGKRNFPLAEIPIRNGCSDFCYIPAQHRELSLFNLKVFFKHKVFHEIATQTNFGISMPKEDVLYLDGYGILSCQDLTWKDVKPDFKTKFGIHQVRFHDEETVTWLKSQNLI